MSLTVIALSCPVPHDVMVYLYVAFCNMLHACHQSKSWGRRVNYHNDQIQGLGLDSRLIVAILDFSQGRFFWLGSVDQIEAAVQQ